MFRVVLYMVVCIPALALAQSVDSTHKAADSALAAREARVEGREVRTHRDPKHGASEILGRDELAASATLADALTRVPGVAVRRMGGVGGFSEVSFRQSPSQQVRVVVDGVAWKDQGSSTVDLGQISTDGIESVEILQGAGMGGDGRPQLRIKTRSAWLRRGISGQVGSFGERQAGAWWGDRTGVWSLSSWWQAARNDWPIRWDRGTEYNTADDIVVRLPNNDFLAYGAGGAWRPTPHLTASARWERSEKGGTGLYVAQPTARWNQDRIQLHLESQADGEWAFPYAIGAGWAASRWRDSGSSLDYRSNRDARERGWTGSASWKACRQVGDWRDGWVQLFAMVEQDAWATTTPKEIRLTPDASRWGGGFSLGWTGQNVEASKGAEIQARLEGFRDQSSLTDNGMASVDAEHDSTWLRQAIDLKAMVWWRPLAKAKLWMGSAMSDRVPDFFELYGDNGLNFASTALQSERSLSFETGGAWSGGGFEARTSGWGARYWRPIRRKMIGASMVSRYENDSGYSAVGWEVDLGIQGSWGSARTRLDFSRTWLESEYAAVRDREMDHSPGSRWNLQLASPAWKHLTLSAGLDAVGDAWASSLNRPDDLLDGHLTWGLGAQWVGYGLTVSLQGINLGDRQFEEFERAPLSGRSYRARLQFDFDTKPKGNS